MPVRLLRAEDARGRPATAAIKAIVANKVATQRIERMKQKKEWSQEEGKKSKNKLIWQIEVPIPR